MTKKSGFEQGGFGISPRWVRGSALLGFLMCASMAVAQLDTGTISGTVTDQSGAAVPGATITIRNVETGISRGVETGPAGRYDAPALRAGNYEVRASLTGFQTLVRSGIVLTVGRNAVVDMVLQVGEVTQAITITGEASYVETTTATVSNLVDAKKVLDIPLNNRDLTQLAYLQPGVLRVPSLGGTRRSQKTGMGDKLSVAGGRPTHNVYLLDGVSNSDVSGNSQSASRAYTGAETVKEFQIITNNYSAEYPSKPGAIISAVTKPGPIRSMAVSLSFSAMTTWTRPSGKTTPFATPRSSQKGARASSSGTTLAVHWAGRLSGTERSSSPATRACGRG